MRVDDVEAIKQLKARYFRTMDTKYWAGMRRLFTDDVVMDTTDSGGGVVTGADTFMTFLAQTLDQAVTVHHGHMPEIEITSPTTANGIWAMQDFLKMPEGSPLGVKTLIGWGHYTETYELVDGAWKIKTLVLTRLRRDVEL